VRPMGPGRADRRGLRGLGPGLRGRGGTGGSGEGTRSGGGAGSGVLGWQQAAREAREKRGLGQQPAGGRRPGAGSSAGAEEERVCLLGTEKRVAWMH